MQIYPKRQLLAISLPLLCALVLLVQMLALPASAATADTIVRVGLYYSTGALASANLANEVGSGYRFGYYDSSRQFHSIASTDAEKITVTKDSNYYITSGSYYETPTVAAYTLLGAYHLQLDSTYSDYASALSEAEKYAAGFVAYIDGEYVVRFEYYSSADNAANDASNYSGVHVVGGSATGYTVTDTGTNEILFEYDSSASFFGIEPRAEDGAARTWFKGMQYYGGFQYCRRSGGNLSVLNFVDLENYTQGVVPYEMSASWPLETLKAGAVAARTYVMHESKHAALGFDVCTTTDCQVYHGVYTGSYAATINQAVDATAGECIYYDGALIEALYHSADGGATESSSNAWGIAHDYLVGKEDPYETSITTPSSGWSYAVTSAQLTAMVQKLGDRKS
ncbi:MAG: SpoIID/LytB domain-containing protein, partial [Oscillospiraceae bacterium]|nr:SpoIID/LytB domain-containing protein [Oscillospiraceae bacterium]